MRTKDLKLELWNEIYTIIEPFTQFDTSSESLISLKKIQSYFFKTFSIKDLASFVDGKRNSLMRTQLDSEKNKAIQEHQNFIKEIMKESKALDPSFVRDHILKVRVNSPRLILYPS